MVRFKFEYGSEYGVIEVDQEVLDSVDDNWRGVHYYNLLTPEQVAAHIAWNMLCNDLELDEIDGFTQFNRSQARITTRPQPPVTQVRRFQ